MMGVESRKVLYPFIVPSVTGTFSTVSINKMNTPEIRCEGIYKYSFLLILSIFYMRHESQVYNNIIIMTEARFIITTKYSYLPSYTLFIKVGYAQLIEECDPLFV